ncbi:putative DsbA family dithiol-disulfide isomerase [Alteromonadaceae bacterium 2753L.S.0a.02]|nr:putative DsbA family dithiol-disulfide isomerase [Alteromonadaceae bacterium 2753L.S.0a.02]
MAVIQVDHYSDVLCIWAYVSQVRVAELISEYAERVDVKFHFFPVFGDVPGKMQKSWAHRGGIAAYGEHVLSVAERFEHLKVAKDVWVKNTPQSSLPAHLFLSATQLLESEGALAPGSMASYMNSVREAFFVQTRDVSSRAELLAIAEESGLETVKLEQAIDSGRAHAVVCNNNAQAVEQGVNSSPTLIFNEGRQKLAGNVGYRIIEANIRELLENPAGQLSWC